MNTQARNYPPPPYPRKPRYRVNSNLSEPWREVTDAELLEFGDNPANYHPETVDARQQYAASLSRQRNARLLFGCFVAAAIVVGLATIAARLGLITLVRP